MDPGNDGCYNQFKQDRVNCLSAFEEEYFSCPSGPSGLACRLAAIDHLEECEQAALEKFRNCVQGAA